MSSPNNPDNNNPEQPVTPGADLWSKAAAPAAPAASPASAASAPGGAASGAAGWERDVLEKLVFASLSEQRAARRWRLYNRLLWTAVVLLVIEGCFHLIKQKRNANMLARNRGKVQERLDTE